MTKQRVASRNSNRLVSFPTSYELEPGKILKKGKREKHASLSKLKKWARRSRELIERGDCRSAAVIMQAVTDSCVVNVKQFGLIGDEAEDFIWDMSDNWTELFSLHSKTEPLTVDDCERICEWFKGWESAVEVGDDHNLERQREQSIIHNHHCFENFFPQTHPTPSEFVAEAAARLGRPNGVFDPAEYASPNTRLQKHKESGGPEFLDTLLEKLLELDLDDYKRGMFTIEIDGPEDRQDFCNIAGSLPGAVNATLRTEPIPVEGSESDDEIESHPAKFRIYSYHALQMVFPKEVVQKFDRSSPAEHHRYTVFQCELEWDMGETEVRCWVDHASAVARKNGKNIPYEEQRFKSTVWGQRNQVKAKRKS